MKTEAASITLTGFMKRGSSRRKSFPEWESNAPSVANPTLNKEKYATDSKSKAHKNRIRQHNDASLDRNSEIRADQNDVRRKAPNDPPPQIPVNTRKCCRLCPPRWTFSVLILIVYLVFFGCSLSYSWVHVLGDPICDVQKRLCNMQLIGCVVIMASLVVFGVNLLFHIANFKSPNIQRHYVRVLFLVPVLCAQSWVFLFASREVIISYSVLAEAFKTFSLFSVLHLFMNFFWENCQGHQLLPTRLPLRQVVGLQFFVRPIKSVREFYITTIIGAYQCVIFRPFAFALIATLTIYYPDNSVLFYSAKGINVLQWASQCYAIYAVLLWARNFREDYYCLSPLIKHFGLMLFHILLPTLTPQVTDILIHYEIFDLEDFFNGSESQHIHYKVQGFFQACFGFLGTFYLTWMYSSRDVKMFSNESTPRHSVTTALSQILSPKDFLLDFDLMGCPLRCRKVSKAEATTPTVGALPSPAFSEEAIYHTNEGLTHNEGRDSEVKPRPQRVLPHDTDTIETLTSNQSELSQNSSEASVSSISEKAPNSRNEIVKNKKGKRKSTDRDEPSRSSIRKTSGNRATSYHVPAS